jgi:hypothetical protein
MKKNAQLTIFIIIGIILVASVALFFAFRGSIISEYSITDTSNVKSFVDDCIDEVGIEVIKQVSDGGGYYFSSNKSTSSGLAIYYSQGQNFIPTKEEIQNEISFYVAENLFFCTKNFVDFPDLEIKQSQIKVETKITDEEVVLNVNYPIRITKGDSSDLIRDFEKTFFVRLGVVYEVSKEILQTSREDICLSCILDISLENDLYVDMNDLDNNKVMFAVRDENSKLNGENLEWVFVIDYE